MTYIKIEAKNSKILATNVMDITRELDPEEFKLLGKEFMEEWITALISGEFKQGTGALWDPRDNTFCCLGVGCFIKGIRSERLKNETYLKLTDEDKDPSLAFFTWDKNSDEDTGATFLAQYNDSEASFTDIAAALSTIKTIVFEENNGY